MVVKIDDAHGEIVPEPADLAISLCVLCGFPERFVGHCRLSGALVESLPVIVAPDCRRRNSNRRRQQPRNGGRGSFELDAEQTTGAEDEKCGMERDSSAEHGSHVLVPPGHRCWIRLPCEPQ